MATLIERFWSKVETGGECWVWGAGRDSHGYGRIKVSGQQVGAHRLSWLLAYGPIPDGLWVLHACDNPPCVRPGHLFLGTHADNMADAREKGRLQGYGGPHSTAPKNTGSTNGAARLTELQVAEMRIAFAAGARVASLAREFGVAPSTAWSVVHRVYWRHV